MPELPEVETVAKTLATQILNKEIKDVDVFYDKMLKNCSVQELRDVLIENSVQSMSRRGKYLIFELKHGYLLSHLRMEGKYFYEARDVKPTKHVHLVLTFLDETQLFYEDTRKFGTFHYFETREQLESSREFSVLGVEPMSELFTVDHVARGIKNKKKPIKSLLLDQSVVVGLGNIYVDEVLFGANLHPLTPSHLVTPTQMEQIIVQTNKVLGKAIELKGTTIRTFASAHGSGNYQHYLRVHQREKEACLTCGETIVKIKVGGRGTYYCPQCQPLHKES